MSAFIKTLSDLIALTLQALRLSVLLPAAVLVGLNLTFILPMLKNTGLYHSLNLNNGEFSVTFFVFLSILVIAYFLSVANIPIIRFFEGFLLLRIPLVGELFCRMNKYRVHELQTQMASLSEEIESNRLQINRWDEMIQKVQVQIGELDKEIQKSQETKQTQTYRDDGLVQAIKNSQNLINEIDDLKGTNFSKSKTKLSNLSQHDEMDENIKKAEDQRSTLNQQIQYIKDLQHQLDNEKKSKEMQKSIYFMELCWFYPHHQTWRILPTKLGNILASAEEYSSHLYGLDAVTFWPFLSPILSEKGYATFVEREKTSCDFPLNMLVITLFFGFEIICTDILLRDFQFTILKLLLIVCFVFLFYLLSLQGALSWGFTIRTAPVLYRDKLRERLGLSKPKGFYEERIMWQQASRFYLHHDPTQGEFIFDYEHLKH